MISKLLERAVSSQLVSYLDTNGLMPRNQSAYRQHHSTKSALTVVFTDIIEALDSGNVALFSLLDLSAAFDCVDHDIILHTPTSYGLDLHVFNWLSSHLRGRSQHVHSCGKSTVPEVIKHGMPQRSVLGLRLFVLYTANIDKIIELRGLSPHFTADDTNIYIYNIYIYIYIRVHPIPLCQQIVLSPS